MGVKVRFYRGAWWIFIDHNGRRKAKKVRDRATADKLARALRERLARGDLHLPNDDTESLTSYAEAWLAASATTLKASTLRFYRDNLTNHLLPVL